MTWGTKIFIAYGLFIFFIVYLVIRSTEVNTDLVAEDYYQQELAFQTKIDKQQNLQKLGANITVRQQGQRIEIQVAAGSSFVKADGTITFMRAQDKRMDRSFDLALNEEGKMAVPTDNLIRGKYMVQLDWKSNGVGYYHEEPLFVQ